jgi:O-antigen ligase
MRAVAAISASVIGLTLAAGGQFLWARFKEPNPFSLRWDLIQSSMEMFRERPLTGWGLGTWPKVYPGFARYDDGTYVNQAHCDWAQWASEGGVLVFAALAWTLLVAVRAAWRNTWGWGVVVVFIHALIDYPFQQRPQLAVFLFVFIGLALRDKGRG